MDFKPYPKPEPKPKKKTKIKKVSDKRKKLNAEYSTLIKVWKEGKFCKRCGNGDIDVHHSHGKVGKVNDIPLLLYVPYFVPLCRPCHRYIEDHPDYAYANGYSVKRLINKLYFDLLN